MATIQGEQRLRELGYSETEITNLKNQATQYGITQINVSKDRIELLKEGRIYTAAPAIGSQYLRQAGIEGTWKGGTGGYYELRPYGEPMPKHTDIPLSGTVKEGQVFNAKTMQIENKIKATQKPESVIITKKQTATGKPYFETQYQGKIYTEKELIGLPEQVKKKVLEAKTELAKQKIATNLTIGVKTGYLPGVPIYEVKKNGIILTQKQIKL